MTFDEWYDNTWNLGKGVKEIAGTIWDAITEEFQRNPPDGLYRIAEEVEVRPYSTWDETQKGKVVVLYGSLWTDSHECIRRKPAWVPKDGEPVLFECNGKSWHGIIENDSIMSCDVWTKLLSALQLGEVKPYKPGFTGKPWDEV